MIENSLQILNALGQSVWLDDIGRELISSGKLQSFIGMDGIRGLTSNPSIFKKAIKDTQAYADDIIAMSKAGRNAENVYDELTWSDVQAAADEFRPIYYKSDGNDGYVSLEVNPHLAHDTHGTIADAHRLWLALDRPNVMIKVPATDEGIPAIEQLIRRGMNVNVTLLFGIKRYRQVMEAYISGLETRIAQGKPIKHIDSVASFFISRIDTKIDPLLDQLFEQAPQVADLAKQLTGNVAISSAKIAYQIHREMFTSVRFKKLEQQGANVQRLLWASTGTKNPQYSDVKYVEALIGPNTVTTIPEETLDAYRDHGYPKDRLKHDSERAFWVFERLSELGIDMNEMAEQLEGEGVTKFTEAFDQLILNLSDTVDTPGHK